MRLNIFLLGAVLLAACGDSTTAPTVDGVYFLQRVNGRTPPAILEARATDTTRATGGTITLKSDGTWSAEMILSVTAQGITIPTATSTLGTYTHAGETLDLREARDGTVHRASVRGGLITATLNGVALEYERK
jgi:hypothetical protein